MDVCHRTTDKMIEKVDKILDEKQAELMAV